MNIDLSLGLSARRIHQVDASPTPKSFDILGGKYGFAIDFTTDKIKINDKLNPSNNFYGSPKDKLTVYGSDPWKLDPIKGLNLSASRDFSVAIATNLFPYKPSSVHVYARYQLNAADSADQRYLFMFANSGNNRFAYFTTSGNGFRWVSGDGNNVDTELSNLSLVANTEYEVLCGGDQHGRTWVDDSGIVTNDQLLEIEAASVPHMGIGGYPDRVLRVLDGYLAEIVVICEDIPVEKRLQIPPFPELYAAEGDSHTFNVSFGMPANAFYPSRVSSMLGNGVVVRNAGTSGQSSAEMLSQVDHLIAAGVPDVATIYAGSNDTDTNISLGVQPTTSTIEVVDASKMTVGSWLVINGESRQISSIIGNVINLAASLSVAPKVGDVVAFDTTRNIQEWIKAMKLAGVKRLGVIGSHYLNFPSMGDTPTSEQSLRGVMRVKQKAAADLEEVHYVDLYAHMRDLIVGGSITQGDWTAWHQGASDTHLNAAGEQVIADAVRKVLF